MSGRGPVVSVIVPTLNRPDELAQALSSITAQRGLDLREIEVIVVNDGGTPIDHVVAAARDQGLDVRSLAHPQRLGLPSARNCGIDQARGVYLAFLDDDDVFLPHHLVTALHGLESGTDVVVTTCLVSDHRVDPAASIQGAVPWDVAFNPGLLEAVNLFPVHTAVLRSVTALPAWFGPALPAIEDWDFWLRLTREHGYQVTRLPDPTVVYHRVPQAGSMIGAVASGVTAMADFSALVRRVWARWPASTPRAQRFRLYSAVMYWQVLGQLAAAAPLNPHYYLQSIQALADAWAEPSAEATLIEQLTQTVTGEHDDQHLT